MRTDPRTELAELEARFSELGLGECPDTCGAVAEYNYLSRRIAELRAK